MGPRSVYNRCMYRLFALGCFLVVLLLLAPRADARYTEANVQCPPGGKIGQSCTDNTNGYQTKGKCAYVYVCKATNVDSKVPPTCVGGKGDCPVGGPPPSDFNPYPKPIKIASTSAPIPKSGITGVEQGVLNSVFSDSDEIDPSVDLDAVSANANAQLYALYGADTGEEILAYIPESFDTKTSTLFESLRAEAVALSPGQLVKSSGGTVTVAQRLAYASGGFFGGTPAYGAGGSDTDASAEISTAVLADAAWSAPRFLAKSFAHAMKAALSVILADFSAAGTEWHAAGTDMRVALAGTGVALTALWHLFTMYVVLAVQAIMGAL